MAKVKITGHASGTGILTVTAPNTSTDRTITLPDATGTLLTADGDGSSLTGIATPITALNSATANELVTVGGTTTELDAETNLTFDGTDLTIGTGNLVMGTAGKGIDFSVQTATGITGATTTSEVFDHYEEGTWTAVLGGSTASGGNRTGYYIKVGNLVYFTIYTGAVTYSSATGAATCAGIPFISYNAASQQTGITYVHGTAIDDCANAYMDYSDNRIYWVSDNATSSPSFEDGSGMFILTGTYRAA